MTSGVRRSRNFPTSATAGDANVSTINAMQTVPSPTMSLGIAWTCTNGKGTGNSTNSWAEAAHKTRKNSIEQDGILTRAIRRRRRSTLKCHAGSGGELCAVNRLDFGQPPRQALDRIGFAKVSRERDCIVKEFLGIVVARGQC